jgi:hypothetical protein
MVVLHSLQVVLVPLYFGWAHSLQVSVVLTNELHWSNVLNESQCLDTVKNRYMTQPDVSPKKFPTPTSVARYVYQTEGLKGFYRGFLPSFLRAFPTNASAVFMFEFVMKLLSTNKLDNEPL